MSHSRSGRNELSNFNTGFDLSTSLKVSATATAQHKGGEAVDSKYGKGTSSTAKQAGNVVYDMLTAKPVDERYSGNNWSPSSSLASDPQFQKLRTALDESAATSDAVRKEREDDLRKRSASVAAIAATYVPIGTIAAGVLYAFTEGFIALGNLLGSNTKDSPEQRERAQNAARRLWAEWMMLPPPYSPELESAEGYADRVEKMIPIFAATERSGPPWQEEWLRTMAGAIDSPIPVIRDVSRLGWIPIDAFKWIGNGFMKNAEGQMIWTGLGLGDTDLTWGQSRTTTHKPGFLSAERETVHTVTAPTFDQMMEYTDRYAAGVGCIVAARFGVQIEPVVEAAIAANRKYALDIGPSPHHQGWRLKGVFLEAMDAAAHAPRNVVILKLQQKQYVDPRLTKMETVRDSLVLKPEAMKMLLAARKKLKLKRRYEQAGYESILAWHQRKFGKKGLDR